MTRYPNADVWSESLVVVEIYLRLCSVFVDASENLTEQHMSPLLSFTYLMQERSIIMCRRRAGNEVEQQYLVSYTVKRRVNSYKNKII